MTSSVEHPVQLPLGIRAGDGICLENFYPGRNQTALAFLTTLQQQQEQLVFLWGVPASGISYLLQAIASEANMPYIPLSDIQQFTPELLSGLEQMPLLCIDDVQNLEGRDQWQEALFHLFNRQRALGGKLVIGSKLPPLELPIQLADLKSRLNWGTTFHIEALNDDEKLSALIQRAKQKGIDLTEEVANYILSRYSRDPGQLFNLLDELDRASLAAQRKLTVPFVRDTLMELEK